MRIYLVGTGGKNILLSDPYKIKLLEDFKHNKIFGYILTEVKIKIRDKSYI